jgi:hypothetical protein
MEPNMQRLVQRLVVLAITVAAGAGAAPGCRLDPLVGDQPGASANVLPSDAVIPSVSSNADLTNQIALNDGLSSTALMASGNLITRGTGIAGDGAAVKYWGFGDVDRAPTPIYVFDKGDPMSPTFGLMPTHPPLVEVVPGDIDYEPVHTVFNVAFTDKYAGQKITTMGALSDAIDLQLVQAPVAIKVFVNWPIVRPGLQLEVGGAGPVPPTPVYARGYLVDSFPLGGMLGRQPNPRGVLPTSQVSFLREAGQATFDQTRPIFQVKIPTAPAQMTANYTPLSLVVNVDLAPNVKAATILQDSDLFMRATNGDIAAVKPAVVAQFTVTTKLTDFQIQFMEGQP